MSDPRSNEPTPLALPEEKNRDDRRKRASQRNASIVSLVVHGVFLLLAGLIVAMTIPEKEEVRFVAPPPPRPRLEPRKLEMKVRVNQLTKRSSRPKLQPRMMVNAPSELALPEIKQDPDKVKKKIQRTFNTMGAAGFGSGVGGGFGTGMGGGMGGMGLPPAMADRCSAANRSRRLRENGGRASSEKAVQKALAWLQTQQNGDGSFGSRYKVAMTGLAVLAYLGHCETPQSALYGETVKNALDYLVRQAGAGGLISDSKGHAKSYSHGIATYALGEAYIMTGEPEYREPFESGVQTILSAQNHDGGWVYDMNGSSQASDTSVSGWQIQAMKSAYLAGLDEDEAVQGALELAMDNMKRVYNKNSDQFGYRGPDDKGNLTGIGVFCLTIWKNGKSKEARGGIDYLMKRLEDNKLTDDKEMIYSRMNAYGMYYDVQAMFAQGGRDWKEFNRWFQEPLVDAQNDDGSWRPTGGGDAAGGGAGADWDVYRTALNTLMLEVYYRYLPVVDM